MRPEDQVTAVISSGPVTRSRDHQRHHQAFVMDAAPPEPQAQVARVLVSDPLQRNLEAARKHYL